MNHLENLRRRGGRKSPDAITVKYSAHQADDDDGEDSDIISGGAHHHNTATPGISVSVVPKPTMSTQQPAAKIVDTVVDALQTSNDAVERISPLLIADAVNTTTTDVETVSTIYSAAADVQRHPDIVIIGGENGNNTAYTSALGAAAAAAAGGGGGGLSASDNLDTLSVNSAMSGMSARDSSTSHGSGKRKWLSNLKQKIEHKFEKIEHKIEEKIDNYKSEKAANNTDAEDKLINNSNKTGRSGMTRSPSDLSTDSGSSKKHNLNRIFQNDSDDTTPTYANEEDVTSDLHNNIALHASASAFVESDRLLVPKGSKNRKTSTNNGNEADSIAPLNKVDRNVIKVQTDLLQRCLNPADDYDSDVADTNNNGVPVLGDKQKPWSFGAATISAANNNNDGSINVRRPSNSGAGSGGGGGLSTSNSSAALKDRGGFRSTSIAYDPTVRGRMGAKPPKSIQFETIVEGVHKKIKRERYFHNSDNTTGSSSSSNDKKSKKRPSKSDSKRRGSRKNSSIGETASDTNSADEAIIGGEARGLKGHRSSSRQSVTSLMKGHAMSRSLPSLVELPSASDSEQQQSQDNSRRDAADNNNAESDSRTTTNTADDADTDSSNARAQRGTDSDLSVAPDLPHRIMTHVMGVWPINIIMQHGYLWLFVGLVAVLLSSWLSSSAWNFISGFMLGAIGTGFAVYKLLKPVMAMLSITNAPPPPTLSTSQAINYASDIIAQRRDNKVADKKVYEAWMLELPGAYKAADFVISDTHLIFIRLDGPILRIQRPKHEYLAHKVALDEKLPKAPTFVHQRIIDLDKSRVVLHPEKLSNSQRWNKKYPIVVVTQQIVSSTKTQSKQKVKPGKDGGAAERTSTAYSEKKQEAGGAAVQASTMLNPPSSASQASSQTTESAAAAGGGFDVIANKGPNEECILLFARTNRQKEQWFWLLTRASKPCAPNFSFIPDVRLYQSPNFTPLNAIIHRLFADALSERAWHDVIEYIIEDKLSKVALPTWIGDFKMSNLQLGKRIPLLSDVCDKPVYNEMGLWLDVWFEYHGGLTFRLETKLNLMELKRSENRATVVKSSELNASSPMMGGMAWPTTPDNSMTLDDINSEYGGSTAAAASSSSSSRRQLPRSPSRGSIDTTSIISAASSPMGGAVSAGAFYDVASPTQPAFLSVDAEGNLCESEELFSSMDSNNPSVMQYRVRAVSDANADTISIRSSTAGPRGGASAGGGSLLAPDTISLSSSSGGSSSTRPTSMSINTTTTSSTSGNNKLQATEGAAEMKRNKFLRFVDKIAQSKYFQSATENKYIKKAMVGVSNTPLTLQVELQRISGRLQINIPPPPSDKLWWGFAPTPHVDLNARPFYGEKEVKTTQVIAWLEKRLVSEINKIVTSPNFDDVTVPFMNNHIHTYEQRLSKLKDVFL